MSGRTKSTYSPFGGVGEPSAPKVTYLKLLGNAPPLAVFSVEMLAVAPVAVNERSSDSNTMGGVTGGGGVTIPPAYGPTSAGVRIFAVTAAEENSSAPLSLRAPRDCPSMSHVTAG